MASFWNIPIFAYTATAAEYSDSKVYKTLLRTSFQSLPSIFDATAAFLIHHNLTKVGIVANIGTDSFEKITSLENSLKSRGITITRRVMFEESSSAEDLVENGIMNELKDNTRGKCFSEGFHDDVCLRRGLRGIRNKSECSKGFRFS